MHFGTQPTEELNPKKNDKSDFIFKAVRHANLRETENLEQTERRRDQNAAQKASQRINENMPDAEVRR